MTLRGFFIVSVLALLVMAPIAVAFAQTAADQVAAREAQLRAELEVVLAEIEAQKKVLVQKQAEGASIARDISILDGKINQAKLTIKAHEIAIQGLGKDIGVKTETINTLTGKVDQGKASLRQLVKKTNYIDDYNITEVVLSNKNISTFFQDLDSYFFIKGQLNQALDGIKQARSTTEIERTNLDKKRIAEVDAKISVEAEKRIIEKAEAEKQRLLNLSKKEQQTYANDIKGREARANAIRSALFSLRDSAAIPFGKAFEYATLASQKTGVRPAFILGILTQESDLGKNIGTCNRPGDPPNKSWKVVMKPERDQTPFLAITTALGIDPNTVPVSCPIAGGWGGAMGPSQFIPSTWQMYATRIGVAVGATTPSPWNPQHAIMATAIYLADLGAGQGGYTAERTAALKYYAGGNWKKAQNQFYGNQVMQKAKNIQENMINLLQGL